MSGRELNYSAKLDISNFSKSTTQALKEARELNKELAKGGSLGTNRQSAAPSTAGISAYREAQLKMQEALRNARLETERLKTEAARLRTELESGRVTQQNARTATEQHRVAEAALRTQLQQGRITQQQYNTQVAAGRAAQIAQNAALTQGRIDQQSYRTELARIRAEQAALTAAQRNARNSQVALSGSYREAQQRLTELGNRIRSVQGGFDNASPAMQRKIREYNELNAKLKAFDAAMGNHQRKVGDYRGAIQGAGNDLLGLASGYLSAGAALQYVLKSTMEFQRIKTPLTYILGSEGDALNKLDELKTLAGQLGLEYFTLASSYKSFSAAARASNFDLVESEKIFTSVTKASAVLGLSSEQLSGSLLAIQQMISKGNVQAEELRGQLAERLPGAFALSAKAMGVTESELNKLLQTGQVLAQDLLPKLANELDKQYGNKAADGIKGLNAEWQRFITSLQSTAGESSALSRNIFEPILAGARSVIDMLNNSFRGSFTENFRYIFSLFNSTRRELTEIYNLRASNSNNKSALAGAQSRDLTGAGLGELKTYYTQVDQTFKKAAKDYETFKKGIADGSLKETTDANLAGYARLVEGLAAQRNRVGSEIVKQKKQVQQASKELKEVVLTSVTDIRKEIARLSKLDGSAVIGSDIYNQIEVLKGKLAKPKDTTAANASEYKKAEREAEALGDKLTKLLSASSMASMTADEKEVESVKAKYAEMQKEADEFYSKGNGVKVRINGKNVSKSQVDGSIKAMQKAELDAMDAKDKAEAVKKEKDKLDGLLKEFMNYAQKREALTEQYNSDMDAMVGNPQQQIERAKVYDSELEAIDDANVKKLDAYEALFNGIDQLSSENARTVIANAQKMLDDLVKTGGISKKLADEIAKMLANTTSELKSRLPDQIINLARGIDEVANSVGDLDEAFGKALHTVANVVGQVGNIKKGMLDLNKTGATGFEKLTAGLGIFGAAFSLFKSASDMFGADLNAGAEQREYANKLQGKQLEAINKALERQIALINEAYGTDKLDKYNTAILQSTANEKKYQEELKGRFALTKDLAMDEIIKAVNSGSSLPGMSRDFVIKSIKMGGGVELPKELDELQRLLDEELLDESTVLIVTNLLKAVEVSKQLKNNLAADTIGSSLDSIADSFVSALTDGTQDFSKTFEDIIKTSIINGFKSKLIEEQLQPFYDLYAQYAKDGLDSTEIEKLKLMKDEIIKSGQKSLEDLEKVTGAKLTGSGTKSGSSLQGDIKSITTEQAGVMTGTLNGLRIAQLDGNRLLTEGNKVRFDAYGIAKSHFDISVKIEQNTLRTANNTDALSDIKTSLASMDRKIGASGQALAANGR